MALSAALLSLLTSCGSDGSSATDQQGAQAVLLNVSNLPSGSKVAKKAIVGEQCNPVTYFQSYAVATADPFGFNLPGAKLLQTVGVFEDSTQARKAFAEITSKSARDCVGVQMQKALRRETGVEGTLTSEIAPRSLAGETSKTMQLEATGPLASVEVERTAILHGRLLTTLTFISVNQPLSREVWKSVSRNAADLLDGAAASIET